MTTTLTTNLKQVKIKYENLESVNDHLNQRLNKVQKLIGMLPELVAKVERGRSVSGVLLLEVMIASPRSKLETFGWSLLQISNELVRADFSYLKIPSIQGVNTIINLGNFVERLDIKAPIHLV